MVEIVGAPAGALAAGGYPEFGTDSAHSTDSSADLTELRLALSAAGQEDLRALGTDAAQALESAPGAWSPGERDLDIQARVTAELEARSAGPDWPAEAGGNDTPPGHPGGEVVTRPTLSGAEILATRGISAEPVPAPATLRFPDGAHFRIEIPSVEGPDVLRAVVDQAAAEGVTVNRVSQGSGAMLLSAAELSELARIGAGQGIEVSLFVGPREEWDVGSLAQSGEGPSRAGLIRGVRQLRYAIDDVLRGVEHGIRGFLVADTGLLELLAEMQSCGQIPASVVWKVSAMLAPSNPLTVRQLARFGASTINVPSDVTLGQLAEMRAATSVPIDLYVEAPSGMGGVVRGQEAADLVSVAAPMYVKFGLRNSRLLYPSGLHLVDEAARIAREKVHRASVALDWMRRSGLDLVQSGPGATGLGVPEPS